MSSLLDFELKHSLGDYGRQVRQGDERVLYRFLDITHVALQAVRGAVSSE